MSSSNREEEINEAFEENNIIYSINSDKSTATVLFTQSLMNVFIPPSIDYKSKQYSVTSISEFAFTKILPKTIQYSVNSEKKTIEQNFYLDYTIKNLSIPSSVTELKDGWCKDTQQILKINIDSSNPRYTMHEDQMVLGKTSIDQENFDVLIFCIRDIKSVTIPSFIKHIGQYAFKNCIIQKVEFSENSELQTIENGAFMESAINDFIIPLHLTKISSQSFCNCTFLRRFEIPLNSELQTIEKNAFFGTPIECLSIPSTVVDLKDEWCGLTSELNAIEVDPNNQRYAMHEDQMVLGKTSIDQENFDVLIFCIRDIKSVTIPSFIKHIGPCAFNVCCCIEKVEITKNSELQSFGKYSFSQSSIKSITIPKCVTRIGEGAFCDCYALNRIEISPDSNLKVIDMRAFEESKIEYFTIPSTVTKISESAFNSCSKLRKFVIPSDSELRVIENDAFCSSAITSIEFPLHLTKIGKHAFKDCRKLQIIGIADNSEIFQLDLSSFDMFESYIIMIPAKLIDRINTI